MSDQDRGTVAEDRLPWLEPVDEEDVPAGGIAAGKLLGALIAALVAIGLIVGGGFWLKQRGTETASVEPGAIPAPPGPYKVKPANPGGMQVPGQGDATYSASEGKDPDAKLDMNAVPEQPIKAPAPPPPLPKTAEAPPPPPPGPPTPPPAPAKVAEAKPAPAPEPKAGTVPTAKPAAVATAKPAAPKPAASAPATASKGSGVQVQLGAFSSEAKANAAWKKLTGQFGFLGSARQEVVSAKVGSGTVYRLRASGATADACSKLKAAGQTCIAVGK